MSNYHSQNIYVQNFIRAKNYDFTPAYSELIGRLCGVESALTMRESVVGFCSELMTVFKGSGFHSEIDRVCLATRLGHSNGLAVLDSANTERAGVNAMDAGYHCFVSPSSTLFSLREGEIRMYDEASRIAEAFEKKHKPVQRSIAYIIKMGFRSGACFPLHLNGHLSGFLFFNSMTDGLFGRLVDEDYAVLNVITMLTKLALASEISPQLDYRRLAKQDYARFASELFDEDVLGKQLSAVTQTYVGDSWRPTVRVEGDMRFLFSPTNVSYLIAKVCESLYCTTSDYPKEIQVVNRDDGSVQFLVPFADHAVTPTLEKYREHVRNLEARFSFLQAKMSAGINHVVISYPFEPIARSVEDVRYSVE